MTVVGSSRRRLYVFRLREIDKHRIAAYLSSFLVSRKKRGKVPKTDIITSMKQGSKCTAKSQFDHLKALRQKQDPMQLWLRIKVIL